MNIFVAGVHGVGKTYLASQLPTSFGLTHASASKLIREERSLPDWNFDKRVIDIDENQIALASAVMRYNRRGIRLLLDGHFVLLDANGSPSKLGVDVFKALSLSLVLLLESSAALISSRIFARDGRSIAQEEILKLICLERDQAKLVCQELNIPLLVLENPTSESFANSILSK
jgi:adenylate kinase